MGKECIWLKDIEESDLYPLWELSYGPLADLTWKEWDGPYFNDPVLTWEEFAYGFGRNSIANPHRKLIMLGDALVGMVTAYWEDGRIIATMVRNWDYYF